MGNKNTRTLNVSVECMAVYNSSIEVPSGLTLEEAVRYAKRHLDVIFCERKEWIGIEERSSA